MIIGGKNRRYTIEEDSHILAAIALYLDIINLFLYILEILGKMKS
jgi:FtsH-binding integral membrane protein